MFSNIALQSNHRNKTDRNRRYARKAYDALLHYIPRVTLSADEAEEVESKISYLKSELRLLGEQI
jgi:hypothetical protein